MDNSPTPPQVGGGGGVGLIIDRCIIATIRKTLCLLHRHRDRAPTPRSTGDGTLTGKG